MYDKNIVIDILHQHNGNPDRARRTTVKMNLESTLKPRGRHKKYTRRV